MTTNPFLTAVSIAMLTSSLLTTDSVLQADTKVGGQLSGNVTWTRAESPYVTVETVQVPAGSTLTIEPGVEIRLLAHSFIVRGTLLAKGTAEAQIRFTSQNAESPAAQDWAAMTFEGPSSGAKYDRALNYLSGSILEHVIVEHGQGLFFNAAAPFVSHCTIRHHRKKRGGGIYGYRCTPIIRDSVISNNVAEMEGGGIRTAYCQPVLIGNTITQNSAFYNGGGVSIDYSPARIEGNTISYNYASYGGGVSAGQTQVGQISLSGKSHSKPQILGNRITNNTACYSGGGILVKGTPAVVGNIIAGNRIHYTKYNPQPSNKARIERDIGAGAGINVTHCYGGPLTVKGNVIVGNRGAFWGAGMCFDRASGTINQNWIFGNRAILDGSAVSILVRSPSIGFVGGDHGAQWRLSRNEIQGNAAGVFELAMARNGGKQSLAVSECNLANNEGKVFVNHSESTLHASNNWWGVTDVGELGELIEDFHDNTQYGQVRFDPADAPNKLDGLPEVTEAKLVFLATYPEGVRAGQGFHRIPGTPPSVTITWKAGNLEKPAGYRVYFSTIEPRFEHPDLKSDLRIAAKCLEGSSPVDVGDVTRTVLSGFSVGQTYEFSITAYDATGLESSASDPFAVRVER